MEPSEIIARLKFLKNVNSGEKIHTASISVQPDMWITPFLRFVEGENKNKTLAFVKKTIDDAFSVYSMYSTCSDKYKKKLGVILKQDIAASLRGVNNLKSTYRHDLKFTCDLDTLVETVETRLASMDNDLDGSPIVEKNKSTPIPISENAKSPPLSAQFDMAFTPRSPTTAREETASKQNCDAPPVKNKKKNRKG
jgi:hypothetical protein